MRTFLARLAFWRRRDEPTWDEIVAFLSGDDRG